MRFFIFQNYQCYLLLPVLVSASFFASAMSQNPDEDIISTQIESGEFKDKKIRKLIDPYAGKIPEEDARTALKNNDKRLLAFPLRATSLPGVELTARQAAIDACGVRYMKGFGDIVHSDEHLRAMRIAYDYATRYNSTLIKLCPEKPDMK